MPKSISPGPYTQFRMAADARPAEKPLRLKEFGDGVAISKFARFWVRLFDKFRSNDAVTREKVNAMKAFLAAAKSEFGDQIGNEATHFFTRTWGPEGTAVTASMVTLTTAEINKALNKNELADEATIDRAISVIQPNIANDLKQLSLSGIIENAYEELRAEAIEKGHTLVPGMLQPHYENLEAQKLRNPSPVDAYVIEAIRRALLLAVEHPKDSLPHCKPLTDTDAIRIATNAAKEAVLTSANEALLSNITAADDWNFNILTVCEERAGTLAAQDLPIWDSGDHVIERIQTRERAELARCKTLISHQEMRILRVDSIEKDVEHQVTVFKNSKENVAKITGKPLSATESHQAIFALCAAQKAPLNEKFWLQATAATEQLSDFADKILISRTKQARSVATNALIAGLSTCARESGGNDTTDASNFVKLVFTLFYARNYDTDTVENPVREPQLRAFAEWAISDGRKEDIAMSYQNHPDSHQHHAILDALDAALNLFEQPIPAS